MGFSRGWGGRGAFFLFFSLNMLSLYAAHFALSHDAMVACRGVPRNCPQKTVKLTQRPDQTQKEIPFTAVGLFLFFFLLPILVK